MSSAARFAEMADPERNPQFRRRWAEPQSERETTPEPHTAYATVTDSIDHLADVIAADFRAARAGGWR